MSNKSEFTSQPISLVVGRPVIGAPTLSTPGKVIQLAERAHEIINITELEPDDGTFIGKHINRDGSLTEYPKVTWWRQSVARVPASISHMFAYLSEARKRNICLLRGAPANVERQPTRRQKAGMEGGKDRGDHGFVDAPTRLFALDVDGMQINWRADPERAIRTIVGQLGEPWASTSFVWFFSAKHGLEWEERVERRQRGGEVKRKHWTGKIIDGKLYARIVFITERALNEVEASALTSIAKVCVPKLDASIARRVQPNYITRPQHPDGDVLGDIPTIGWIKGTREYLTIPDDLTHQARWAKAQGHHVDIADHPDAEAAVRGIGSDGRVRQHLLAAVEHLLRANPVPDVVSFADHSIVIEDELQKMVTQHREEIEANLARHGRYWAEVLHYQSSMQDWCNWLLDHPGGLNRKTIQLSKEEPAKADDQATRDAIFERVARAIERARKGEAINGGPLDFFLEVVNEILGTPPPPVVLLVAPTGSRKSTLMRAAAVQYVAEHPKKTVVILMPRHRLGDEQIELLRKEHPNADFNAAVWRGRHADDPDSPDPKRPGKFMKMCQREEEVKELEKAMLNVEHHLCKQWKTDERGKKEEIKCPLYDDCAWQRQKQIRASIWFAAHECMVHEMPKAFGDVGWVIIDESPLDAFIFGVDHNDTIELALDALRDKTNFDFVDAGRDGLYRVLDPLVVPINHHQGVPVSKQALNDVRVEYEVCIKEIGKRYLREERVVEPLNAKELRRQELKYKAESEIRPNMTARQVRNELKKTAGNGVVAVRAALWQLVDEAMGAEAGVCGRIQVHRGHNGGGRTIRMVGLKRLAKGWNVQTLICDATGDAELLRAIWPDLETDEGVQGWQQLPRPKSVRVFQCVDRSISKWAVAVEAKNPKELERKIEGARRLYGALLMKALEYGGADVGVIIYKSTREWIEQNCCVPRWMKLVHWGDVTGTNKLEKVRALFPIGRPMASPEDVARQTEALFGEYVHEREYVVRRKRGRIPIVPDTAGNNTTLVDVREHPHPMGQRVARQITEAAIIQAAGRARAGLRSDDEPLDIHLWTDVPVPELGPVEPVLWNELEAGLDGLMLATGGVRLESIPHAAKAYEGLFTADGLKSARKARSGCSTNKNLLLAKHLHLLTYQRAGKGQRPQRASAVIDPTAARAWLEEKLGSLVRFEVEGMPVAGVAS